MEHTRQLLAPTGVLRGLSEDELRRLLHEETLVVEFEPLQAKRSLGKLVRGAGDRIKLHKVFDSLEADAGLDARQRNLLAELRTLVPLPATLPSGRAAVATRKRVAGITRKRPAGATRKPVTGATRKRVGSVKRRT